MSEGFSKYEAELREHSMQLRTMVEFGELLHSSAIDWEASYGCGGRIYYKAPGICFSVALDLTQAWQWIESLRDLKYAIADYQERQRRKGD